MIFLDDERVTLLNDLAYWRGILVMQKECNEGVVVGRTSFTTAGYQGLIAVLERAATALRKQEEEA